MPSNFSLPIDGGMIAIYLIATMAAGIYVRRYVSRVDHFLVAGREMTVYLGIASLAATEFGIITCMYTAQNGYKYGFAGATPGLIQAIVMLAIGLTGFCIKPLRDSGVTTIPELFERRFGSRVRWLAGLVIALGGLLNMGVFLRVGGEFLTLTAGLDPRYLEVTMTVLLIAVSIYTILGGMLSVLVTDFLQFVVMSAGILAVTFLIFANIGWSTLVSTVETHHQAGGFNPLMNKGLGWDFVIFQILLQTAATLTWQAVTARLLAAKDSNTGRKVFVGTAFFFFARFLIPGLWGIAALATLSQATIATMPPKMQEDVSLFAMPLFLATFVPAGLMGLLLAAMLAAEMSTDSSYMLTWASVIFNDLLGPLRKKRAISEARGLVWNRFIVAAIGVFLLFFGLWYELEGDLWAYCTTTGTIYLASMSTLLVACCYWKRANSWGAIGAIVAGAIFPIGFLVLQKLDATKPLTVKVGANFANIAAFAAAAIAMVVGSLTKLVIAPYEPPSTRSEVRR